MDIWLQFPTMEDLSLHCNIQTDFWAYSVSYLVSTSIFLFEVKHFGLRNVWTYTSTPYICMVWCLVKHQRQRYLYFWHLMWNVWWVLFSLLNDNMDKMLKFSLWLMFIFWTLTIFYFYVHSFTTSFCLLFTLSILKHYNHIHLFFSDGLGWFILHSASFHKCFTWICMHIFPFLLLSSNLWCPQVISCSTLISYAFKGMTLSLYFYFQSQTYSPKI